MPSFSSSPCISTNRILGQTQKQRQERINIMLENIGRMQTDRERKPLGIGVESHKPFQFLTSTPSRDHYNRIQEQTNYFLEQQRREQERMHREINRSLMEYQRIERERMKSLMRMTSELSKPKPEPLPRLSFTGKVQMEASINPHRALMIFGPLMEVRHELAKLGRGRF